MHKASTWPDDSKVDALCLRLIETAQATDDDVWRNTIRSLIAKWDHPAARKLASDDDQLSRQSARSLFLLAEVLEDTRGRYAWVTHHLPETIAILKRAWTLNPNDYQISRRLQVDSTRTVDRIRFATVAVAAAPSSPIARLKLAEQLTNPNWHDMTFREQMRLEPGMPRDKSVMDTLMACELPFRNGGISILGIKRFDRSSIPADDMKEGVLQLREAIRLDPQSVSLRESLAMTLIWQGNYDEAIAESRAISEIDPTSTAMSYLGLYFCSVGEIDRAFEFLQSELNQSPSKFYNLLLVGTIYHKRGQKDRAFAAFREYLLRAMNEPDFKTANAYSFIPEAQIALESIGGAKEIIATYRKAIEAAPSPPRNEVVSMLGAFLIQEGMADEALTLYREEIAAKREHSAFAKKLADYFLQSGRTDEALAVYREGIQSISQSLGFHRGLADLLKQQGKGAEWDVVVDNLIPLLRAALEREFDVWGQAELAELYLRRGRRDEARAQYRILVKKSDHHNCINHQAMSLAASPDEKDRDGIIAVELAIKVCELTGWSNSSYLDTLVTTYAEVGDFDAAVKWQNKAIEFLEKPDELEDYKSRLKLFQEKKPYRYPEK